MIEGIIAAVIGILAGVGGTTAYSRSKSQKGQHKADQAIAEAKIKASDMVVRAKDDALRLADEAKKEENDRRRGWEKTENRLAEREVSLDRKLDELDHRAEGLRAQEDPSPVSGPTPIRGQRASHRRQNSVYRRGLRYQAVQS